MNLYSVVVLICVLVIAYAVTLLATTYTKWTIERMKKIKSERKSDRAIRYRTKVKMTSETLDAIVALIARIVLIEIHQLDDVRGINNTNASHYKKLLEKISDEVYGVIAPNMGTICTHTLLDQKFIEYFIIRHTELLIKQSLGVVMDESDEPTNILGGSEWVK